MISVVYCSIDEAKARAVEAHYRALLGGEPHEIIAIRDARSLAEAYNRAIDRAAGELLVFSHDDIEFLDPATWLGRLKAHAQRFEVVGVAGTTRLVGAQWAEAGPPYTFGQVGELDGKFGPYRVLLCGVPGPAVPGIQALDGLFFAVRRETARAVRFDAETFDGFHGYDIDFTYRAHLAGRTLAVATDLPVLHASQGGFDDKWEAYAQRFLRKHGATLAPAPGRLFQHGLVIARTPAEILEIMAPPKA
jgi:GT2 family glycosyltransferase